MIFANRITPDNIVDLPLNHIFVFGSNLAGRHGKGAAKKAVQFGAVYGQSVGLQGRCYAIPTKNHSISNTLPLSDIQKYIDDFIEFASKSSYIFLVTEIGCGLAGYSPKDIGGLFKNAINKDNIHLPLNFWKVLLDKK